MRVPPKLWRYYWPLLKETFRRAALMTSTRAGLHLAFSAGSVLVIWLLTRDQTWWVLLLAALVPVSVFWLGHFVLNMLRIPVERQDSLEIKVSNQEIELARERQISSQLRKNTRLVKVCSDARWTLASYQRRLKTIGLEQPEALDTLLKELHDWVDKFTTDPNSGFGNVATEWLEAPSMDPTSRTEVLNALAEWIRLLDKEIESLQTW
jgi:hypothetical protein